MTTVLSTSYEHSVYEKKWWNHWMQGGWFHAEPDPEKTPYTILIPPPNVTDRLHMGHGLNNTIQDILVRWKRMQGFNCCWLPGTDHAGIATQMMVEKALASEGLSAKELGRERFFERCVRWKHENGSVITEQLKRLGASCDWEREAYTLSPELSTAVRKIFVDLFEKGLIYRGERLVNWDPVLKTAISDDELESQDVQGNLWYYRYPLADSGEEYVTIATSRPETMFGDTAVAVHPEDLRYQKYIGRKVKIPFTEREIPVIADDYVRSEFGTGCVKITPAHDPNDFDIGRRHHLPFLTIMHEDATLNDLCPSEFRGLDRYDARKKILIRLKEAGLFDKTEPVVHAVPYSSRTKVPVEPRLSEQWYVKMSELAEPAIQAAKQGTLRFFPSSWEKTYLYWLENIQDWCISRQLWWGHRIPVWYCGDCHKVSTGMTDPESCHHCGSKDLEQDADVLDTWFSSWLWPLSPFGWPDETRELDYFFPSAVLVTGPDIIYLWVARMIMASFFTKGTLPFRDVYFNAIICDKQGQKFSKTLGNGIDPLKLIDRYGADAVRYTCVSLAPLGGRVKMEEDDFVNGHRFVNKLRNAARFLLQFAGDRTRLLALAPERQALPTRWLMHELRQSVLKINHYFDTYHMNEAIEGVFHLAWRSFCDWGLESAKETLADEADPEREQLLSDLIYIFDNIMRLASPVMPFICEEIWQSLPAHPDLDRPESLVIARYPDAEAIPSDPESARQWEIIQGIVSGIRSLRTQAKVPPGEKLQAMVRCSAEVASLLSDAAGRICYLANLSCLTASPEMDKPAASLMAAGPGFSVWVPVGEWLDFDKEKQRLSAEALRIKKIVHSLEAKLANASFLERAPASVVSQSREQLENMKNQLHAIEANLASF